MRSEIKKLAHLCHSIKGQAAKDSCLHVSTEKDTVSPKELALASGERVQLFWEYSHWGCKHTRRGGCFVFFPVNHYVGSFVSDNFV